MPKRPEKSMPLKNYGVTAYEHKWSRVLNTDLIELDLLKYLR